MSQWVLEMEFLNLMTDSAAEAQLSAQYLLLT